MVEQVTFAKNDGAIIATWLPFAQPGNETRDNFSEQVIRVGLHLKVFRSSYGKMSTKAYFPQM